MRCLRNSTWNAFAFVSSLHWGLNFVTCALFQDHICISEATTNEATGVVSLIGKWLGAINVVCITVRPDVAGGSLAFGFEDNERCPNVDAALHTVPVFKFDAAATPLRCPGNALDGTGLLGWGTEEPAVVGRYQDGYCSNGWWTSPIVNTL